MCIICLCCLAQCTPSSVLVKEECYQIPTHSKALSFMYFSSFVADDVKILLVVINETENKVVKKFLKPPHTKLSRTVTLGKFGGHKVALMHTNMGDGCSYPVRKLLQNELQQVDKVIAIGVAGGAKKEELGDVLVSEWIECGDTTRVGKEVTSSRGRCVVTPDKLRDIFCKGMEEWSGKEFLCDPEASRYSKVHAGVVLSASILWDNKDQKERLLAAYAGRKFIGMEMEGKALIKAAEEVEKDEMEATGVIKRKIAVIVIKGVCDYGDGDKEKSWQPVAAEAAASYAEFKLQEVKTASYTLSVCVCACMRACICVYK